MTADDTTEASVENSESIGLPIENDPPADGTHAESETTLWVPYDPSRSDKTEEPLVYVGESHWKPATDAGRDENRLRSPDVVRLLGKIHDLLDRSHRQSKQHDFSVVRLFAALIQMFAIVAALWGLVGLMNDMPGDATARLSLACFLQLASISAYVIDRFR